MFGSKWRKEGMDLTTGQFENVNICLSLERSERARPECPIVPWRDGRMMLGAELC